MSPISPTVECITTDASTILVAYGVQGNNLTVAAFEQLIDQFDIIVPAETRKGVRDNHTNLWENRDLDRIAVRNKNAALRKAEGQLIASASASEGFLLDPQIRPRITLIALAKLTGATVVSDDAGSARITVSSLCARFGVPFVKWSDWVNK